MLIKLNEGEEIRYVGLVNSLCVESSVDGVHARRKGECGEPVYFLLVVLEQKNTLILSHILSMFPSLPVLVNEQNRDTH